MTKFRGKRFYIYISIAVMTAILAYSLLVEPIADTWKGYKNILTSPSIILTDYLFVGGLAATLINVLTTTLLNILIIKLLKVKFDGAIFACLFTIAGFAFFGKNLFNALPIYLGVYLFAKATRTKLKEHITVLLLSSGISPITSYLIFGAGFSLLTGIIIGSVVGIVVGFILPAFNNYAMKFHQGYNLYNTGFSMGVISMVVTGLLSSLGVSVTRSAHLNEAFHETLLIGILILSALFVVLAIIEDRSVFKKYTVIFRKSGRLITDYFQEMGVAVTLLNLGIMGFLTTILVLVMGISISGPVAGAFLTIIGFSALGKNPFNSFAVVAGAIIAIEFTPIEYSIGAILSILFVTGLSPVSGQFGALAGIIAGFIHVMITPLALTFQGGFDLYNNGFAAGFVAALLVPLFSVFLKKRDENKRWNFILPFKPHLEETHE